MRKEYLMYNVNEAVIKINYGKMSLTATFSGGDKVLKTPASFATENELYQLIIENSDFFNNSIFYNGKPNQVEIIKATKRVMPEINNIGEVDKDTIIVDFVKTTDELREYLMNSHNVTALALRTPAMIVRTAKKMKIKTPNLEYVEEK